MIEIEDDEEDLVDKVTDKKKEKKCKQKEKKSKNKTLKIIGDSIVNNIDIKKVEEVIGPVSAPGLSGPEAKYNRAYCSKYDPRAMFPNNNQEYKIPQLLNREMSNNLLIQASVTDITNLSKIPKSNKEYLYGTAQDSSVNTMKTVEKTLEKHPLLKIILMKRPPRYDNMSEESEFANFVLDCLGEKARMRFGDRLVVAEHTILYEEGAKDRMYGVKGRTQGYDGIHLRGVEGQEAYTRSVVQILKRAGLEQQWQEVRSKDNSRKQEFRRQGSRRQESRRQEYRRQDPKNNTSTSNRFEVLN